MTPQDLAHWETEAAELLGAMKDLFKEFEKRLGEAVSAQRLAMSEARSEGARVTQKLQELGIASNELVGLQRNLLSRIERDWQLRIDENAQRAGATQAAAFGEGIAQGLHTQLTALAVDVERATRRLSWNPLWDGRWASRWRFRSPST